MESWGTPVITSFQLLKETVYYASQKSAAYITL